MTGKPLNVVDIAHLLKEDAEKAKSGRGPKVDKTEERTYSNWYKQFHHFCFTDCEHRSQAPGGSEASK